MFPLYVVSSTTSTNKVCLLVSKPLIQYPQFRVPKVFYSIFFKLRTQTNCALPSSWFKDVVRLEARVFIDCHQFYDIIHTSSKSKFASKFTTDFCFEALVDTVGCVTHVTEHRVESSATKWKNLPQNGAKVKGFFCSFCWTEAQMCE